MSDQNTLRNLHKKLLASRKRLARINGQIIEHQQIRQIITTQIETLENFAAVAQNEIETIRAFIREFINQT